MDERLALFVEQMDMLRADFVAYSDGKKSTPFPVLREAIVAALNEYDEVREYLTTQHPEGGDGR